MLYRLSKEILENVEKWKSQNHNSIPDSFFFKAELNHLLFLKVFSTYSVYSESQEKATHIKRGLQKWRPFSSPVFLKVRENKWLNK